MGVVSSPAGDLRERVASLDWYHTLELAPGVVTPGWFDTRPVVDRLPLPARLDGKRSLDVGTYDGFWAFEMERRGAEEVVGIDVLDARQWDWPVTSSPEVIEEMSGRKAAGTAFDVASRALDSSVRRLELSVYDLDPVEVGEFDFVYVGSLLLHLRDPVRALERVRAICRGDLLVVDNIDLLLTLRLRGVPAATLDGRGRPWWWKPNLAGLVRLIEAGGFEPIEEPRRFYMPLGAGQKRPKVTPRRLLTRAGREAAIVAWRGDPHGVVRARPTS